MKASELKNFDITRERLEFACLIAFHVGALSGGWFDGLNIMSECLDIADSYDFDVELEDGEWYINTELAREAAENYAAGIVEREQQHEEHKRCS